MDLHANIHDDVPKLVNIIRTYRTAPHVDQEECERITAELLVDCIKRKAAPKPVFKRVLMITPGEKATTNTEPIKSIFNKIRKYEKLEGILLANYVNGHAWTDRPNTSASVVVIPKSEEYRELAEKVAGELADYAFGLRHDFKFHQLNLGPDESLERALAEEGKPVFITDSGDNVTGGAPGINTLLLQKLMARGPGNKKVVVAAILDAAAYEKLSRCELGEKVSLDVGVNHDADSAPVRLNGTLKAKGEMLGYYSSKDDVTGAVCTVSVGNVDVAVANSGDSFTTINHFARAGLNIHDYDIAIVKQGYLFTELNNIAKLHIMAMTPGACNLIVENLEFKQLLRPMYPLDK
jgi:microcystin degradation protein MlrC